MNIENKKVPITNTVDRIIARYRVADIEQLIRDDLAKQGIILTEQKVCLLTDYKYVVDEWGMNSHLTTVFLGATVDITYAKRGDE